MLTRACRATELRVCRRLPRLAKTGIANENATARVHSTVNNFFILL